MYHRRRSHDGAAPRVPTHHNWSRAAVLAAAAAVAPLAQASNYEWTGGSTASSDWSNPNNWSPVSIPSSTSVNTTIEFNIGARTNNTQDISDDFLLNSLTFDSNTTGPFTISGGELDFRTNTSSVGPTLVQNAQLNQTVANSLALTNTLTFSGSGSGTMTLSGGITGAGGLNDNSTSSDLMLWGESAASDYSFLAVNDGTATLEGTTTLNATGSTGFGGNSSLFVEGGATLNLQSALLNTYGTPQVHNNGAVNVTSSVWNNDAGGGNNEIRIGYAGGTSTLSLSASSLNTGGLRLGDAEFSANPGHGSISATGNSNITAETLTLDDTAGSITIDNSNLSVDTFNCIQSGTTITMDGSSNLYVGIDDGSSTLSATLVGLGTGMTSQTIYKQGSGTLTLSSSNTKFFGYFDLQQGNLAVANDSALGGAIIYGDGGALYASGADRTIYNAITVNSSLTLATGSNDVHNLTVNSEIQGSGGLNVDAPGATVTIAGTGNPDYTGPTSVTGGTLGLNTTTGPALAGDLSIGNSTSPGAAGSVIVNAQLPKQLATPNVTIYSDGLLNLAGTGATFASLTMTGGQLKPGPGTALTLSGNLTTNASSSSALISTGTIDSGALNITVADGAATYDLDLQSQLSGGTITKNGAGTMRLGLATSDPITLDAGTLAIAADLTNNAAFTLNGGTLVADGANHRMSDPVTLTANSTIGSSLDGTPRSLSIDSLSVATNATLTVNNNAATTLGTVNLGASTLTLAGSGNVTINNGITDSNGTGELVKSGAGTLTLTAGSSFGGGMLVTAGTVMASSDSALGASTSPVSLIGPSTVLQFTNPSVVSSRTFNLADATLSVNGGSFDSQAATINGGALGAGTYYLENRTSLNGVRTENGTALTVVDGAVSFSNVLLSGNTTLTVNDASELDITGDFTTNPQTSMTVDGTVYLAGGSITGAVAINNGGSITNSNQPLYLDGTTGTTINAGGILSADGTTIELGGLLVNNGIQTGVLDVDLGGIAKGTGHFDTVNVESGGKFSPGNSPGTATVASLTFGGGGTYQFEIQDAAGTSGSGYDFIDDTGPLTLTAGDTPSTIFTIELVSLTAADLPGAAADFNPNQSYDFPLVGAASISGFDAADFTIDTSGFANSFTGNFSIVQNGNTLDLQYSPVPEPASGAVAMIACGMTLLRRRRRAVHTVRQGELN